VFGISTFGWRRERNPAMAILVSDTSVLIDLERGQLLEPMFTCGLVLVVPDYLYQTELEPDNGPYLRALGLGVLTLNPEEVTLVQATRSRRNSLSLPDCFALVCALRDGHILLTGDGNLRAEAELQGAQVRGLLWALDQIEASGRFSNATLHSALSQIAGHKRCRLPKNEVSVRLTKWG
jgi:hypothetical protein